MYGAVITSLFMSIKNIIEKTKRHDYRFSDHAVKQMIRRSIQRFEVEETIGNGEIIEHYPEDKYSPS
jgi:hypothetical protein